MNKFSSIQVALFGAAVVTIVQPQQICMALSPAEVGQIAEQITVLIETPGSPGSGIIIGKNGNIYSILTAKHIADNIGFGEEAEVITNDGQTHDIDTQKIQKFPNTDLAILEFSSDRDYPLATLGKSQEAKIGTTVYVAGFPEPTQAINRPTLLFTKGEITANANRPLADGYALVYNNNTLFGMSGGAVLNENGEIIGVHGRADRDTINIKATENPNVVVKTGFNLGIPIDTYLSLTGQLASRSPNAQPTADDYFLQAGDRYDRGGYNEAIDNYDEAIRLNPNYAVAYNNRGLARSKMGDKQGAFDDYNRAIYLNPNSAETYYNRGSVRADLGDKQGAFKDYSQALSLEPNLVAAYNNRGNVRYELGDLRGAIEDYDRAISLNPNLAEIYSNRGLAKSKLQDKEGAIEDYNRSISLNAKNAEAYYNRGIVRYYLKDTQGAIDDLQQAANLFLEQKNQQMYQQTLNNLRQIANKQ